MMKIYVTQFFKFCSDFFKQIVTLLLSMLVSAMLSSHDPFYVVNCANVCTVCHVSLVSQFSLVFERRCLYICSLINGFYINIRTPAPVDLHIFVKAVVVT